MSLKFDDVRLSVCVSVCVSRSDRNWTGFETSYGVLRVVNMQKILFLHTFLKKKMVKKDDQKWSSFFLPSFLQSFLVSDSSSSRSSKKWPKHVFQSCVCMYTTPETIETFSENARCLDDASSAEIILLIQRVCIISFEFPHKRPFGPPCFAGVF